MRLYTSEEIRKADALYTENDFTRLIELIKRAGNGLFLSVPINSKNICIVSGCGNNGADGLAAAILLLDYGYNVNIFIITKNAKYNDAVSYFINELKNKNADIHFMYAEEPQKSTADIDFFFNALEKSDTVIDCIFGTGFSGTMPKMYEAVINEINSSGCFVVSADIPSGVCGDTGEVNGIAVKASKTVSFAVFKPGNVIYPGREFCGECMVFDIGFTYSLFESVKKRNGDIEYKFNCDSKETYNEIKRIIGTRKKDGHKGDFGKVLIIAGSEGMTGAAILSAKAALKSGAGLVYIAAPRGILPIYEISLYDAVKLPLGTKEDVRFTCDMCDELIKFSENADTVMIGPGLSRDSETVEFTKVFLKKCNSKCNFVIDADALYAFSESIDLLAETMSGKDFVITPHGGEFCRLIGSDLIIKNRLNAAKFAANALCGNVLLKGDSTIIASCNGAYTVNGTGNCGMATGGSGDVLSGIIAGISASAGLNMYEASCVGAFIHGLSGDIAAGLYGEISLTASDLTDCISMAYKKVMTNEQLR